MYRRLTRKLHQYGHDMHQEMIENSKKVMVHGMENDYFVINEQQVQGSICLLPNVVTKWKPTCVNEITLNSVKPMANLLPPIELLFIGTGTKIRYDLKMELLSFLRENGVVVEILDTPNAAATFNILNAEDRMVAALLLPENAT